MTVQSFQEDDVNIKELLIKFIKLVNHYSKTILFSLLIGLALGLTFFFVKSPIYSSNMVISTGIVDLPSSTNLILTIQDLIGEKNFPEISRKLFLDDVSAKKLKKISLENIFEVYNEIEIRTVKISVEVSDTAILPDLQMGILKYLEENPYVKKRVSIKVENFNAKISFLQNELDQIAKLKNDILEGQVFGDQPSNVMLFNPFTVYEELVELFDQKLQSERDLQLAENFQVIQGFTPFLKPVSPKLGLSILFGFLAGLAVCIGIITVDNVRKLARISNTLE